MDQDPPSRRAVLARVLLAGGAVLLLELLGALAWGHPLDPTPRQAAALLAGLVQLGLFGLLALLLRALGLRAARVPGAVLAAWAAVWGPHTSRALEAGSLLGLPAPALVLGATLVHPGAGLALGIVGGGLGPVLLRRLRWAPRWSALPDAGAAGGAPASGLALLTVDTVRADAELLEHEAFGSGAGWARHPEALSAAPWTLPAMQSLFTGLSVASHGGGLPTGEGYTAVRAELPWLPQTLSAAGVHTTALVCNPHLRPELGFAEGFDRYLHSDDAREPFVALHGLRERWHVLRGTVPPVRSGRDARIAELAAAELAAGPVLDGRPRLLWVHLLSPHEYRRAPEVPPPGWRPAGSSGSEEGGEQGSDPDEVVLRAAYAGNIAATRARLVALDAAAADWSVVITSDHGEAMGEGGHWGHGRALQEAELRVPLGLRGPRGSEPPALPEAPVGTASLAGLVQGLLLEGAFPEPEAWTHQGELAVGGVRRDARAFARRSLRGTYAAVPPPELTGVSAPLEPGLEAALEALGYTEPGQDGP